MSTHGEGTTVLGTDSSALSRPGVLALGLLLVAGYVDAFVFLRVAEVFTANQSGNLIVAGIALGSHPSTGAGPPVVSVLAYVAGASVSIALFDRDDGGRRRTLGVLGTLTTVLVTLVLLLEANGMGRHRGGPRWAVYLTVALAALAMGSQATSIRQVGSVPVLTTAGSGAATNLGIALSRVRSVALRAAASRTAAVLALVTLAYVGGAALGALLSTHTDVGPVLLLPPALLPAAMLVVPLRSPRSG